MFKRFKLFCKRALVAGAAVVALAVPAVSQAALSAADQTAIISGVSASDSVFYAIGGSLLIVMAGIWGFFQVKKLLGSK